MINVLKESILHVIVVKTVGFFKQETRILFRTCTCMLVCYRQKIYSSLVTFRNMLSLLLFWYSFYHLHLDDYIARHIPQVVCDYMYLLEGQVSSSCLAPQRGCETKQSKSGQYVRLSITLWVSAIFCDLIQVTQFRLGPLYLADVFEAMILGARYVQQLSCFINS